MTKLAATYKEKNKDWQDWAAKAQAGDERAYNKLLKDIIPFIYGVLKGSLAHADWADDIVQDVLMSVHKSFHTYSPERSFKPWLSAIINFRRTDFLRKHYSKRDDKKTSMDNASFIKEHVTNPQHLGELKDIEQALNSLPEKQQEIFKLVKIQGYSSREAAEKLGMSISAVKVSVHRTGKKLKAILSDG